MRADFNLPISTSASQPSEECSHSSRLLRFQKAYAFHTASKKTLGRSSPRLISIGQLNALLHLHPRPINRVVYPEPYHLNGVGDLISREVSRLDAFSVYLVHT